MICYSWVVLGCFEEIFLVYFDCFSIPCSFSTVDQQKNHAQVLWLQLIPPLSSSISPFDEKQQFLYYEHLKYFSHSIQQMGVPNLWMLHSFAGDYQIRITTQQVEQLILFLVFAWGSTLFRFRLSDHWVGQMNPKPLPTIYVVLVTKFSLEAAQHWRLFILWSWKLVQYWDRKHSRLNWKIVTSMGMLWSAVAIKPCCPHPFKICPTGEKMLTRESIYSAQLRGVLIK